MAKQVLDSKKKLAKKLEPCDCFEHLPTCQYVKKSDENKFSKKSPSKEVFKENGFWRFEGAHQGYNTKENAEAALEASQE